MTNRAITLHGRHDLRLETAPDPAPGPGEVRVAVSHGGICGSDLHYWADGGIGTIRVREPIILGHEFAGRVESVGDGVEGLAPGDVVAVNPSQPCGSCRFCDEGLAHHCLNMRFTGSAMFLPHEQGGFRDRITVAAHRCAQFSPDTDPAHAACAEPLAVCLHAAAQASDLAGKRVLVTGAGPIGALCAAVARARGAAEVIVTDVQDATLAVASRMGATRTVNVAREPSALDAEAEEKGRIDVAFECSAAVPAIETAIRCLRPRGQLVQVGVAGTTPLPLNMLVAKEISFLGTHRFGPEFVEAARMIDDGTIDVAPILTHEFAPEDCEAAFVTAQDRARAVKVQICFGAA